MIDYIKGGSYCKNNSQKHSKKCKKICSKSNCISHDVSRRSYDASPILSSTVSAATEHWNDASASKTESWSTWKANWDKYSTNYENASLTPERQNHSLICILQQDRKKHQKLRSHHFLQCAKINFIIHKINHKYSLWIL